jgi:hypothetical protein
MCGDEGVVGNFGGHGHADVGAIGLGMDPIHAIRFASGLGGPGGPGDYSTHLLHVGAPVARDGAVGTWMRRGV